MLSFRSSTLHAPRKSIAVGLLIAVNKRKEKMKKGFTILKASFFFVLSLTCKPANSGDGDFGLKVVIFDPKSKIDQTSEEINFPTDNSRGTCYRRRSLSDGKCSVPLYDFSILMEDCCNSIGEGWGIWGHICFQCSTVLPDNKMCERGYKQDQASGACVDVDECSFENICPNGMCSNTVGSYFCECSSGYSRDTTKTICLAPQKSSCYLSYSNRECFYSSPVKMNRMECCCTIGRGWGDSCDYCPVYNSFEYIALCPFGPGYSVELAVSSKIFCNNTSCGPGGRCKRSFENFVPSAECHCSSGFQKVLEPTTSKAVYCKDFDECESTPFLCPNGKCVNQLGNYSCLCFKGWLNNGFRCVRAPPAPILAVKKCREDKNPCGVGGFCYETEESYGCACYDGYEFVDNGKNQIKCIDIDECSDEVNPCGPQVECINTEGCFKCQCRENQRYVTTISSCVDIERGKCYKNEAGSRPSGPALILNTTQAECCCLERGYAWGDPCSILPCPGQNEANFLRRS